MYSPTLHVLILILTLIRNGISLPRHEGAEEPAGFTSREDGPHLGLNPRAMGVVGSFEYPSMAPNARGYDRETWQIHLRTFQNVLPAQIAANTLGLFYRQAKELVNDFMGRDVVVQDFTLRLGDVALEVLCQTSPICWGIVLVFLEEMGNRIANGMVAMYEGQVVNMANGFSLWMKLTVRPPRPRLP